MGTEESDACLSRRGRDGGWPSSGRRRRGSGGRSIGGKGADPGDALTCASDASARAFRRAAWAALRARAA